MLPEPDTSSVLDAPAGSAGREISLLRRASEYWSWISAAVLIAAGVAYRLYPVALPEIPTYYLGLFGCSVVVVLLPMVIRVIVFSILIGGRIVGWLQPRAHVVIIVLVSLGMAAARLFDPNLKVDSFTVWLVGIAAAMLLVPKLDAIQRWGAMITPLLPYLKKAKILGVELELSDKIESLFNDLNTVGEKLESERQVQYTSDFVIHRQEILDSLRSDPRAALLLLAARIEEKVTEQLVKGHLIPEGKFLSLRRSVELGVAGGLFPPELLAPVQEFTDVRNQVAHGRGRLVDDSTILDLISLGTELLKLLSAEREDGTVASV